MDKLVEVGRLRITIQRSLISRKESLQVNKKMNNLVLKKGEKSDQACTEEIWMFSYTGEEMLNLVTERYVFILPACQKLVTQAILRVGKDVEQQDSHTVSIGMQIGLNHFGKESSIA